MADTKLAKMTDTLAGDAAMQMDLGRLREWSDRSFMKFSKQKCKVLPLVEK